MVRLISLIAVVAALLLSPPVQAEPAATAVASPPAAFAVHIGSAQSLGSGPMRIYRSGDKIMLSLPVQMLDRLFFWYAEAVRFPVSAVATNGNSVAEAVVDFERTGDRLLVRNRSPAFRKRTDADVPDGADAATGPLRPVRPIDLAIEAAALGPVIAVFPVLAEADGHLLVDLSATFANDIDGMTAAAHIASAGMMPAPIGLTVDPARSYIAHAMAYPDNLHIRSHLTFRAQDPGNPIAGFQPVSIEVGHSLMVLPEVPMRARRYDDRVGFIFTDFTEFETARGEASSGPLRGVIHRHRLEKADPRAEVSDPVEPIVFYIGPGVPDRWRPYIAAGVEAWQPAFRAAGFSNAIVARSAPDPDQDPHWSPDDARYNVIRWVPQPFTNAMGPSVVDPRSGEILFAHILLWPQVLDWFSNYYWLMARGVDPDIGGLPLTQAQQGRLLTYIVAHEVGHSIGLRHNHLASTAFTVAELRDPDVANERGPNASIMAYGRMNQAAQPGDGVTRVLGGLGPYDHFAVSWGYGVHGATPVQEQAELDRLAAAAVGDLMLRWAAGEAPFEDQWALDPRVLQENVGADRIEATRLGLRKIGLSLAALGGEAEDGHYRPAYENAVAAADRMLASVLKMVGGRLVDAQPGGRPSIVPAEDQRQAVAFLLEEGPAAYDALSLSDRILRADPLGSVGLIDAHRVDPVRELLSGPRLALVQDQPRLDPGAYSLPEMLDDITAAVWGNLDHQPDWRAAQQAAYLDAVAAVMSARPDPNAAAKAAALTAQMHSPGYAAYALATGRDTVLPGYARAKLPELQSRLERAARSQRDEQTRLHLLRMAARIQSILDPA